MSVWPLSTPQFKTISWLGYIISQLISDNATLRLTSWRDVWSAFALSSFVLRVCACGCVCVVVCVCIWSIIMHSAVWWLVLMSRRLHTLSHKHTILCFFVSLFSSLTHTLTLTHLHTC